ncbi:unnamed protein product [Phytophthora lilii]|uniref:Unnamed protein product n=1 Tax=Phytophthora lilii TaxID=2077276 RepID=A0A9W6XEH5_9STRA|nr:unnamed protein product [Phytophthora lilii]
MNAKQVYFFDSEKAGILTRTSSLLPEVEPREESEGVLVMHGQSSLISRFTIMATHQAHRLPWKALGEVYASVRIEDGDSRNCSRFRYETTEEKEKKLAHFSRCLVDALKEFAATDRRPLEAQDEHGTTVDPTTWDVEPRGWGLGYMGYYRSLLEGYVALNLLLMDADKFLPILQRGEDRAPSVFIILCGLDSDGAHEDWIARRLKPVVTEDRPYRLKPLTPDVLQTLRDHSALLFRCLYSISGTNQALDTEFVAHMITPR